MNIWGVGRNYVDHAKELGNAIPQEPLIFLKSEDCLSTSSKILIPKWSSEIHYELEVAIFIGAVSSNGDKDSIGSHFHSICDDENANHLFVEKIALAIDLTARDKQAEAKKNGTPWSLAKSFKNSCPISPWLNVEQISVNQVHNAQTHTPQIDAPCATNQWIDTPQAKADPKSQQIDAQQISTPTPFKAKDLDRLNFQLFKNEALVQDGHTKDMIFNFNNIIQYVAEHFPLKAGDIILTGTPAGVGPLKSGDTLKALLKYSDHIAPKIEVATENAIPTAKNSDKALKNTAAPNGNCHSHHDTKDPILLSCHWTVE